MSTAQSVPPTAATIVEGAAQPAAPTTAGGDESTAASASDVLRYQVADGSEARYRVREQLAQLPAPSDAVGETQSVSGTIAVMPDGTIMSDQSKILVDLRTLKSDQDRRDRFIGDNVLQVNQYPMAEFVPTAVRGLPLPIPTTGNVDLEIDGDMTVRGVTKPVTWQVSATAAGQEVSGLATTAVKFGDFGMSQPRVASVLSVEDNIRLELDLKLLRQP